MLLAAEEPKTQAKQIRCLSKRNRIQIDGSAWLLKHFGLWDVSADSLYRPTERKIAYTVAYYSVPENKSNREVFVMNADGSDNQQITIPLIRKMSGDMDKRRRKLASSNDNSKPALWDESGW